jgi:hypothetical protein
VPKTTILDANLLVLHVVGRTSLAYIESHKRLRAYGRADYRLLLKLLKASSLMVVTTHILTEAANIAAQIPDPARRHIRATLCSYIEATHEIQIESRTASKHDAFFDLGPTDASLLCLLADGHELLTADHDLYAAAIRRGHAARNFNHYRLR